MAVSLNDIVRVSARITPDTLIRRQFGRVLYITTSDNVLTATGAGRVREFSGTDGVNAVFAAGTDDAIREAAAVYFSQSPYPGNLLIARWDSSSSESISEALDAIAAQNSDFYFIVLEEALADNVATSIVAQWTESRSYMFAASTHEAAALVGGDTTSFSAVQFALERARTFFTYSATSDNKALSAAARLSSVNFSIPNSLITMKFKSLPGTLADIVSTTEKTELDRKQVNHYSPVAGVNIYQEGTTLAGFIDVQYWLDWIVNAIQVDVFNLLRTSQRVPLTSEGIAQVKNVADGICRQGVVNGGIAPGTLSEAVSGDVRARTGNMEFSGLLSSGYLIYVPPINTLTQGQRDTRQLPPLSVWFKGSGAVHFADFALLFEN